MCVPPQHRDLPARAVALYGVWEKDPTKWGWGLRPCRPRAEPCPRSGGGVPSGRWGAAAPHPGEGCKHLPPRCYRAGVWADIPPTKA